VGLRLPAGRRLAAVVVAGGILLLALAVPVLAAEPAGATLTEGCTITAASTDGNGDALGNLTGPAASSPDQPFVVDRAGDVAWEGTAPPIASGTYGISVFGLPIWGGEFTNDEGLTSASGTVAVADVLPVDLVGVFEVSGSVKGEGGACEGSAWVKLDGDPLTSIPGLVGIGLTILGGIGVLASAFGSHFGRGLLTGILLGLGLAVLAIVFGFMPLGTITPWVALAAGPIVGAVVGLLPIGGGSAAGAI
jgi:hypothetical protein